MKLLEVRNLSTSFGQVPAIQNVTFSIDRGETLCVVGESGCGKSVTALSILRLISPPGRIHSGEVLFKGRDLLKLKESEMRSVRGNDIAMIFQDPMTSLNPVFTVGEQIAEAIRLHRRVSRKEAWHLTVEEMRDVAIPAADLRAKSYPHEMSGGMRQRVMIAMALACNPDLLIADEPTTALDVTIQAQILDLLEELQERRNLGLLLITHDLGVVAQTADRVAVMYAGQIVEEASVNDIFAAPSHPYTSGLLHAVPRLTSSEVGRRKRLATIEGVVPRPGNWPSGCRFAPRCPYVEDECKEGELPLFELTAGHATRCRRAGVWERWPLAGA
jgi:peptide/nickel transport system ATP-binding protein